MFQKPTNHSMSGFVVCNCFLFVRLQNICFLLQSCNDSFYGCFKVLQEGKINLSDKTLLRREWKSLSLFEIINSVHLVDYGFR